MAPALIEIGLRHPVAYRLRGRLELLSELVGTAPCAHQLDHSPPVLRRVPCVTLGHRGSPSLSPLRHCPRNRVNSNMAIALREFRHSYRRAAPWQASTAVICFMTAVLL